MAHIPDGVLSLPILAAGTLAGAGGLALGVRGLADRDIPRTALLAAVFFIASSLAFPLGPTSVHLLLGGLIGLMLGWKAFPAIFVGLLLQALLFGFGGLTTLGVDLVNMALPGVALAAVARRFIDAGNPLRSAVVAGITAALACGTCANKKTALSPAQRSVFLCNIMRLVIEISECDVIL